MIKVQALKKFIAKQDEVIYLIAITKYVKFLLSNDKCGNK